MNASRTPTLSKPVDGEAIRIPTLSYFRARNRRKLHSFVLAEFKKSGITQAELCRRLRKDPAQISRMLGGPGNWNMDTASDLLFAINGASPAYNADYPLDQPERNFRGPEWIEESLRRATGDTSKGELVEAGTAPFKVLREDVRPMAA